MFTHAMIYTWTILGVLVALAAIVQCVLRRSERVRLASFTRGGRYLVVHLGAETAGAFILEIDEVSVDGRAVLGHRENGSAYWIPVRLLRVESVLSESPTPKVLQEGRYR